MENSLYHKFGKFIIDFQTIEGAIEEIIVEIVNGNEEFVSILITPYDFQSRLKAVDLLFSRYVKERTISDSEIDSFKKIISECNKLSTLRNDLVHSKYSELVDEGKVICLIRANTKLDRKQTERTYELEDLTHETLNESLNKIEILLGSLEEYRQKLVKWNTAF